MFGKDFLIKDKNSIDKTRQDNCSIYVNSCQVIQIGNFCFKEKRENPNNNRVYSVKGIAPAINTCGGGGLQPHIIKYGNKYV